MMISGEEEGGVGGWGQGGITDDVLKFRKVIKFESSCIVTCFSHVYLINQRWKKNIYQLRKQLKTNQRLKLWVRVPIAVSSCSAAAYMCR